MTVVRRAMITQVDLVFASKLSEIGRDYFNRGLSVCRIRTRRMRRTIYFAGFSKLKSACVGAPIALLAQLFSIRFAFDDPSNRQMLKCLFENNLFKYRYRFLIYLLQLFISSYCTVETR